jgi:hypothetical protein
MAYQLKRMQVQLMTTDHTACTRCGQPHVLRGGPHPSCAAHIKFGDHAGEPCGQPRMKGQRICHKHGAKAPQNLAAGARRNTEAAADAALRSVLHDPDAEPITNPIGAFQRVAGEVRHAIDVIGRLIEEKGGAGSEEAAKQVAVWILLVREFRQVLEVMKRLGIWESVVELEKEKVTLSAVAFGRALDAAGVEGERREIAIGVLLTELRSQAELEESGAA